MNTRYVTINLNKSCTKKYATGVRVVCNNDYCSNQGHRMRNCKLFLYPNTISKGFDGIDATRICTNPINSGREQKLGITLQYKTF